MICINLIRKQAKKKCDGRLTAFAATQVSTAIYAGLNGVSSQQSLSSFVSIPLSYALAGGYTGSSANFNAHYVWESFYKAHKKLNWLAGTILTLSLIPQYSFYVFFS